MSKILRSVVVCLPVLFAAGELSSYAGDWPHWRGPNRNGKSQESGFRTKWEGRLDPAWEVRLGSAYSGIAVVGDRVYTCGVAGDADVLVCLDSATGKRNWQARVDDAYENNWGDGMRSTPTVDGDRVYILSPKGVLACYDAKTGDEKWRKTFDAVPTWGYSGSVLIDGDKAIVTVGGEGGGLRALNKMTGEPVWSSGNDTDSGYSTPYPFVFEGTRYVVGFLGDSAVVAEIETGRQVLSMPWETSYKVNASTPIFHDGHLFLSSGYKTGAGLFKLSKDGDQLKASEVYRTRKLKNKFQTPILHEGNLYTFDERGMKCVDFRTGDIRWEQRARENAHGTIVFADGWLIALNQEGVLKIGKASPEGFTPTAETVVFEQKGGEGEHCWTVPTLSYGRLYLRNLEKLVCLDLRK